MICEEFGGSGVDDLELQGFGLCDLPASVVSGAGLLQSSRELCRFRSGIWGFRVRV